MILKRVVGSMRPTLWCLIPAVWAVAVGVLAWQLDEGVDVLPALAVAPALSCASGARRGSVLAMGALTLVVLLSDLADDSLSLSGPVVGAAATVLAVIAATSWTAGRRTQLTAELDRTREIAVAAQQVLMRPLPCRVGGWTVAGEYLSASRGARVGGDFYEVLSTPYGVRVLIGDARGHGLPAIGMVADLLGCFREAAHQEPELAGLVGRLDGALRRHLRERTRGQHPAARTDLSFDPVGEEFATALLVQLAEDGGFEAATCGHPPPYLIGAADGPEPLALGEPLPPLGLFDPAHTATPVTRGRVAAGEGLLLHTDGLPDARDGEGRFFPLSEALARALPGVPADAVAAVRPGAPPYPAGTRPGAPPHAPGVTCAPLAGRRLAADLRAAVVRHTGGRSVDDIALVVLARDAPRLGYRPRAAALSGVPPR